MLQVCYLKLFTLRTLSGRVRGNEREETMTTITLESLRLLQSPMTQDVAERQQEETTVELKVTGPKAQQLSEMLEPLIQQASAAFAKGQEIRIVLSPSEMTTVEAAKYLGISRPTLMKMIRAGEIPAHKVGTHFRLHSRDVEAELQKRIQEQMRALDELREWEMEMDKLHNLTDGY